jgi:general secretion pathway protein J
VTRLQHVKGAVRARQRAFTLVELLVAITILAAISLLIYGAFAGMKRSKEGLERVQDRYREGRLAMARITRELQSAYISAHAPINQALIVQKTAFVGTRGTPADRVDFNAFANRRLDRDSHDTDQCELSYFGSPNPDGSGTVDLVRRSSTRLDLEPGKGGKVEVLATDIDLFDLEYLDATTGNWLETWDSTQAIGQPNRLPLQVRVILVLNGGSRAAAGRGQNPLRFMTKVALPIQNPLNFATL